MNASRHYFDAGNVLSWGPQPMVGIPRVEFVLVREALHAGHNVFLFDRRLQSPRLLSSHELSVLHRLLDDIDRPVWPQSKRPSFRQRMSEARRLTALSGGCAGPELERYLACMVAGDWRRQGLAYQASKLLLRSSVRLGRTRPKHAELPHQSDAFLDDAANHIWLSSRTTHDLSYTEFNIRANVYAILHDLIPLLGEPFFSKRQASRFFDEAAWLSRRCRRIFCPSHHTRLQAEQQFPEHIGKYVAIHPAGLLHESAQKLEVKRPNLPDAIPKRFAVYCATIEPRKNHAMLVEVWKRLYERLGPDCPSLFLIGRWGWNCADVAAKISKAQNAGVPIMLYSGLSDGELIWLYRNATFGVFPSLAEGYGLGVSECLDFGLPCFISDVPSLAEAAQGLMPVLPAGDPGCWADAILLAMRDEAVLTGLRATISRSYRHHPARDFFRNLEALMAD